MLAPRRRPGVPESGRRCCAGSGHQGCHAPPPRVAPAPTPGRLGTDACSPRECDDARPGDPDDDSPRERRSAGSQDSRFPDSRAHTTRCAGPPELQHGVGPLGTWKPGNLDMRRMPVAAHSMVAVERGPRHAPPVYCPYRPFRTNEMQPAWESRSRGAQ
jgi:hypothetical protein